MMTLFYSHLAIATLAQLVEHRFRKAGVRSSILRGGSKINKQYENMEEINNIESFEDFKNRISEVFKKEGLSAALSLEIYNWHDRRQKETDGHGGTIKGRVIFQMELAEIYIAIERSDLASETLNDAWYQANQTGLNDLSTEINHSPKYLNG
jgi:hypothetical protein